jgi:hypothetical protein
MISTISITQLKPWLTTWTVVIRRFSPGCKTGANIFGLVDDLLVVMGRAGSASTSHFGIPTRISVLRLLRVTPVGVQIRKMAGLSSGQ